MVSRKVGNILELVGGTPLIRINRLNPVPGVELLVKLESMNPGGSVKDRIALSMIEEAEKAGELVPGKVVLEASSGNTAIGLAMVCAVKGYKLVVTMSESASEERKKVLRAYGAEIRLTPGHMGTDGAIEEAYRLARAEPNTYYLVDQYNNDANWLAHVRGTGPEIMEATDGQVDVVVATMGTTGTLMGLTRALKSAKPGVRVVGVEPYKGHKIQGLKNMKESYPPGIFHPAELDAIVHVEDDAAFETARQLARVEGILVGMSSGAAFKAALEEAHRLQHGVVVALLPDSGERYLSTNLFVSAKSAPSLNLFNTLTRKEEPFVPAKEGHVTLYSCGPSLDGPPGLSLCRRLVFTDMLRRYLKAQGMTVKHAMNLGDMDDRTVNECLKQGENLADFTRRWEAVFFEHMNRLKVLRPDIVAKASEHIPDMVAETKALLEKGLAYEKLKSVYFRIQSAPGYGKLSKVDLEQVQEAEATAYDYYEKDNPKDFALFKRTALLELKAGIYWATPWGNARPGWHSECACMAAKYLGLPFDIHTASSDLMFPHGDNEIAIAEAVHGKPLARTWLHTDVVHFGGRKVSRGEKQCTVDDLMKAGNTAAGIRYWLLATHYRKPLNCSPSDIHAADENVARLNSFADRLRYSQAGEPSELADQALFEARSGYQGHLQKDLNLPRALAALFTLVRTHQRLLNERQMSRTQMDAALSFLDEVNAVLAVLEAEPPQVVENVRRLVQERESARTARSFDRSDQIRLELEALGYQVFDGPHGSWCRKVRA